MSQEFPQLWALHPESRHKIIMFEKEYEVPRWSKSYGQTWTGLAHTKSSSYMYSGFDTSSNNDLIPNDLVPYYTWIKNLYCKYNQVIANWYGEQDYIAQHSDCIRGMVPKAKIAICSAYANTNPSNFRTIEFKPKFTNSDSVGDIIKIKLPHGSILTICGQTNKQFTHGIPQEISQVCPRISLSFRQMINE